ncbi:hypothetical protein [Roseivirga echinicomitans]|uniref:Uncharacterized protein n=1 Tax=Roseivirga echinicomitans TaxID=296218 RepID=A0A150XVP8_9BACT|nr:hypothetical protein [Roseivirga echinicomitans]KYG82808.1 hypothetical protein AWN68_13550 [Roseivirga echinicomitans]
MSLTSQYPLGPGGSYGSAECLLATGMQFEDVKGDKGVPKLFAPHLKMVKNESTKCSELSIMFHAPSNFVLDAKSAIVCDYMGTELFVFVNLSQVGTVSDFFQCFNLNLTFTQEFSRKLIKRNIFVIPVHGDPEEGEIGKISGEGNEQVD